MQMVIKVLAILLVIWISVIGFAPKKELYYALEKFLQPRGVVISDESLREKPWGFEIDHGKLIVKGVQIGHFEAISLLPLLVYNRVELRGFAPAKGIARFFPVKIRKGVAVYALWHPGQVEFYAEGNFGKVKGFYDVWKRKLHLRWIEVGDISALRSYLIKKKEGWIYERKF